jgi:hypothetical protein
MWLLIILVVCVLVVLWFSGGIKQAQAIDDAKDRIRERAARQVFIDAPVERTKWSNLFMDRIAQSMIIHDRASFRESAGKLAMDQICAYETFARIEESRWLVKFCNDKERKDLALKWPGLEALLRDHFEQPEVLDRLAAETGENFEDGAGMRRALAECAIAALDEEERASAKLREAEGYSFVAKGRDFDVDPCPNCRLVWRDLARQACRGCGHAFPGPTRQPAE